MKTTYPQKLFGLIVSVLVLGLQQGAAAQSKAFPQETWLNQGFGPNPVELSGNSGGQFSADRVIAQERTPTGLCLGYIDSLPNHVMTLEVFFDYLSVSVNSEEDTTLIVQGPGGIWCSDDVQGHNPAIAGQWQPGTYQIWVGSYVQEQSDDYTLLIESLDVPASAKGMGISEATAEQR
jgi:hypothetical protein